VIEIGHGSITYESNNDSVSYSVAQSEDWIFWLSI